MSEKKSIYIHIPFCRKKCVYCDFYSDTRLSLIPEYIQCLVKEINLRTSRFLHSSEGPLKIKIDSIYFGGGTPSLLSVEDVDTVLSAIDEQFELSADTEITFEVNPGTIDQDYLAGIKASGINRLSMGIQSFNPEKLFFLKRIHTVDQSLAAIDHAQKSGFGNISLDLIYGLPFENEKIWLQDLNAAQEILPSHLSCYMLTIEPFTPLDEQVKQGMVRPVNHEALSKLFKMTSNVLSDSGYDHYEISNFSRGVGNRSKHNSKYWDMSSYFGFGPAAHSYEGEVRSSDRGSKKIRYWNHRDIHAYMKDIQDDRLPVEDTETLTRNQEMLEMIMLRLRTLEGLDFEKFETVFGRSFESKFQPIIEQVVSESLGEITAGRFFLNLEGKTRLDSIVEAFSERIL